jgi:hypothetical protein
VGQRLAAMSQFVVTEYTARLSTRGATESLRCMGLSHCCFTALALLIQCCHSVDTALIPY